MIKLKPLLIILFSVFNVNNLYATETVALKTVWEKIKSESPAQQAASFAKQSLEESSGRAQRHWLPRLYLDARAYQTNDPGNSFFGILEQRKIEQTDFAPNTLNHPDAATYTRGALGLDLPLYEGGFKSNQLSAVKHQLKSQEHQVTQLEVDQYASVVQSYGSIAVLITQKEKLSEVKNEIEKLLKNYQVGQKSNPVGYSGLLGMRSLLNRVSGLLEQNTAQLSALGAVLNTMGWNKSDWSPEKTDAVTFTDKFLSQHEAKNNSAKLNSLKEEALAVQDMAKMQKARFLPRIGAFAESSMFNGSRDTANNYTAGVYLQWNLFDPADFGKFKESNLQSMAYNKKVEAINQQETAERVGLVESQKAIKSNLKLLSESDHLLKEQMQVATTLFKNGSISALQFVEILNRRTDLISQESELELGLIKSSAENISKFDFKIPFNSEGENEK